MEACSVTITGTLAFDPQPGKTQSGDPKLTMTLKVQTRSNRTRWIKVRAFGLLAVRSAESYHQGDRVTVRADDLDSWGKVDDRPDSRFQGTGQDNGPRVQSWVFLTAYDIAMSTANDTAISGQSARRAAEPGEDATDENGSASISTEELANREVLAGVTG